MGIVGRSGRRGATLIRVVFIRNISRLPFGYTSTTAEMAVTEAWKLKVFVVVRVDGLYQGKLG